MAQVKEDRSMALQEGSVVFLVGGTAFKIPKAILEINSEVFPDKGLLTSGNEPVVLDDPPEAFEEFCNIMHLPFDSCLVQPNPDLSKVLQVLQIAHKYCAHSIEARAHKVAQDLTLPHIIRTNLKPHLPAVQVVEIASKVGCDDIALVAWNVVIEDHRKGMTRSSDLLAVARCVDRREIWGEAYYEVMLRGSEHWENDPEITDEDRRALSRGFTKCVEALELLASVWNSGNSTSGPEAGHSRRHTSSNGCAKPWFNRALETHSLRQKSYCDILGLLEILATNQDVPGSFSASACRIDLQGYASAQYKSRPSWSDMAGCFTGTPPVWSWSPNAANT